MTAPVRELKSDLKVYVGLLATLITTAFGFVAALAWNGAIQAIIINYLGTPNSITANVVYATIITAIAVVATLGIGRAASRVEAILSAERGEK